MAVWLMPVTRQVPRIPPPPPPALPIEQDAAAAVESLNSSVQLALWVNELALLSAFSDREFLQLSRLIRELAESDDEELAGAARVISLQMSHARYPSLKRPYYFWLMRQLIAIDYPQMSSVYDLSSIDLTNQWRADTQNELDRVHESLIVFRALRDRLAKEFDVEASRSIRVREHNGEVTFRTIEITRPSAVARLYDYVDVLSMMEESQRQRTLQWRVLFLSALRERTRNQRAGFPSLR